MLAARCPQCGAASPVSVATPELLDCSYCPYVGRPPEAVVQELYAAQHALHAMDRGRRQLSAQQLRAVTQARISASAFPWLLGLLVLPLLVCGGSCGAFILSVEVTPFSVLFLGATLLPAGLVLLSGYLLLRSHRRSVAQLALTCAAVPAATEGRPAMCHVCGAPLVGSVHHGLTRCGYCHADNILDAEVMRSAAAQEGSVTSAMAHAVTQHAASVANQSSRKLQITLALAIASPFISVALTFVIAFVLAMTPTPPDPGEEYAVVEVAGTQCYAEIRSNGLYTTTAFPRGLEIRSSNPRALPRIKASELVGREVLAERNQVAKVTSLSRNLLSDTNQLQLTDQTLQQPGSLCAKPPNLTQLADDPRLESCAGLYPHGNKLFLLLGGKLHRMPKSGGPLDLVADLGGASPRQIGRRLVSLNTGTLHALDLDSSTSPVPTTTLVNTSVAVFTGAANRVVYATRDAIFVESEDLQTFAQVATPRTPPKGLAADTANLYWVGAEGLYSVPLAGGTPRQLDPRPDLRQVFVLGLRLMLVHSTGCLLIPAAGGATVECAYPNGNARFYQHPPFADASHGYLISSSASERSGLQAFNLAEPSKFQRHYGPASKSVTCAAVDDDYAYWVDGRFLQRDKKQQP